MNIVILSRGPGLYSTQSLFQEGHRRGHRMRVVDHVRCSIVVEKGRPKVFYEGERLHTIDAIIPRIGASVTTKGAAIIRQFEMMNVFSSVSSDALLKSRDKLRCLQLLGMADLGIPKTVYTDYSQNIVDLIRAVGGLPVIIKLLEGTHGLGVILAESSNTAESVIETFNRLKERIIIQEFIKESKGADIRVFIINGEIVAAMKRIAAPGEFRSNLHQGASSVPVELSKAEAITALKAVEILGLDVAGVDMLQSHRGPLILEVNPSPGLEGISKTSGIDVASGVIDFVEKKVKEKRGVRFQ